MKRKLKNYRAEEVLDEEIEEMSENEEKSDKLIFFEGMSDFFASMLGLLAVFTCLMLLYSLVSWLFSDISQMLGGII